MARKPKPEKFNTRKVDHKPLKEKKKKKRKPFEDMKYRDMEEAMNTLAAQFFNRSRVPFGSESRYYPSHLKNGRCWQWLHIMGRDESPTLKYSLLNGICGRDDVHTYFTHRPTLWRAFMDDVLPGRVERLIEMSLWIGENSSLFRREDILIENRRRFLEAKASGITWIDYDFTDYKDPVEELMERLG